MGCNRYPGCQAGHQRVQQRTGMPSDTNKRSACTTGAQMGKDRVSWRVSNEGTRVQQG